MESVVCSYRVIVIGLGNDMLGLKDHRHHTQLFLKVYIFKDF